MKRKQKSQYKWKRNLFAMLLLGFCFGSLVLLQTQYSRIRMFASMPSPFLQRPKIAFLFIARNRLPLDVVWDGFFREEKENKFSIFVHSRPGFLLNKATTRSVYFLNRQLNDSIQKEQLPTPKAYPFIYSLEGSNCHVILGIEVSFSKASIKVINVRAFYYLPMHPRSIIAYQMNIMFRHYLLKKALRRKSLADH
ncbi:hypothetical protein PVL29_019120 [Vitis rotundifolia]|uniref:Uncharacterized protein n=1 Tax=Vitis rotundifolia TaxID=103349 RepID=A0AA38Z7F5_VITRO|nr:hypothetical protein PVL29_019120 [Vitis rotundifolia]